MAQSSSQSPRSDNIPLGVGTIIATVFALSLGDALIKAIGGGEALGIWQLFAMRSLLAFPVLLGGALVLFGSQELRPTRTGWIAVRSFLLVTMWIAYYASLPLLPLSVAAAAYYTLPLFIVIFAALFAGEAVGRMQWSGVALGFLGVLIVLRPGGDAFQIAALLPILAAMLYAVAMILTRTHCRAEHPVTLALGLNLAFILAGGAGFLIGGLAPELLTGFLSPNFVPLGSEEWRSIGILAALLIVASVGTAIAYQVAPASTVGTFDFAYVGFALIWGFIFFSETPDAFGLVGIALIVAAGILAVRRS
ncbi:MAG: DMT family transporter [Pseudomonadota bacterium]